MYTGCEQNDGACVPTIPTAVRCSSDVRTKLLDNYGTLFKGANCGGPGNCTQLRKAYRPADGTGTATVFLETIGVAHNNFDANNTRRTLGLNSITGLSKLSTAHPFCDGFDFEGILPSRANPSAPVVFGGDPIRRPCANEDDICASDGKMGVVRAIIAPPSGSALAYPKVQCTRGSFAITRYINSASAVCPDGITPIGGSFCFMPFYQSGASRDFNCMNDRYSRAPGTSSRFDGRVYNALMRNPVTGDVVTQAPSLPCMANWRENMVQLRNGIFPPVIGHYNPTDVVCQLNDATQNIGCIVGRTTCAIGFASRPAAILTSAKQSAFGLAPSASVDLSAINEAFTINGVAPTNSAISDLTYPLAHELFLNSVDGFENLTARCQASGRTASYCAYELKIATAFYNNSPEVQQALTQAGYMPLPDPICRGAQASTGCGAPNTGTDLAGRPMQPKTACLPR